MIVREIMASFGRHGACTVNQTGSLKSRNHKVFFEDHKTETGKRIKFDGCPYVILGRKVFDCQHGVDCHAKDKKRKQKNAQVRKEKGSRSIHIKDGTRQWHVTNQLFFPNRQKRGTMFSAVKRGSSSKPQRN